MNYDVKSIKTLEGIEAIRLRAGMYIGSVEQDGVHHITLEIISNAIDEYLNGNCTECSVIINDFITITDNGRGVPFGKAKDGSETLVNIFTKLHTGAKFDSTGNTGYNTSGGMNGIGSKATNALSEFFNVSSCRDGKCATAQFKKGKLIKYKEETGYDGQHGTSIQFKPDKEIFKTTIDVDYNWIKRTLTELSYLSPGLTFKLIYKEQPEEIIYSKNGIKDYMDNLFEKKNSLTSMFYAKSDEGQIGIEVALKYNDSFTDNYKLFTNSIPNSSGTHLTGFRTALTQTINEYAREKNLLKEKDNNLTGEELKEGLVLILSFKMPDPVFSGQTKEVLSSAEARTAVQRLAAKELKLWFDTNPKDAKAIIEKALLARAAREKAKKAKELVRKPKEKGLKAKMQLSNKFIDCISKNFKERNLLLVEGLSAGSAAVEARNAQTDCIYMLRGKIISPLKQSIEKIMGNQEMSDIIRVIGGGFGKDFDVSKINFDKIVITTDGDSDGSDIALLLTTFFFTFMRPLVEAGKLYRAVTPLYILRKKDEELYFYTENELSVWKKEHSTAGYDILRCKGLGELNAADLHAVCFKNQRFKRITVSDATATVKLLETLQGTAVNPRKQYIYDNAEHLGFNFD